MTAELLAGMAGIILSLGFSYIPGLNTKFGRLEATTKRTRSGELEDIIQEINKYMMGWMGYYRLANKSSVYEYLDSWIRRRLRQMIWKR